MLGILGSIFGSKEVISKGLDLIDEAWTSEEEAAENKAKTLAAKTNAKVELLKAYAPFKLAQRYLAFAFSFVFLFIMVNGVLGAMYGWVEMANVKEALKFANEMYLGEIVMAIVAFYFLGGTLESNKKRKEGT